jgi:hypothetical protein
VAPRFLEKAYTMAITEEEAVVSSNPEILPIILAEIKFFFQKGVVCNELSFMFRNGFTNNLQLTIYTPSVVLCSVQGIWMEVILLYLVRIPFLAQL